MGCDYNYDIEICVHVQYQLYSVAFCQKHTCKLTFFSDIGQGFKMTNTVIHLTIVSSQESISIFVFQLKERKDGYVNCD